MKTYCQGLRSGPTEYISIIEKQNKNILDFVWGEKKEWVLKQNKLLNQTKNSLCFYSKSLRLHKMWDAQVFSWWEENFQVFTLLHGNYSKKTAKHVLIFEGEILYFSELDLESIFMEFFSCFFIFSWLWGG